MKAFYLLAPLSVAALVGCAYETTYTATPTPVAYATPTYVAPSSTVVLGAAPATSWALIDSDGDGYANGVDRYPYDARFH
jgi:hypothetical protein